MLLPGLRSTDAIATNDNFSRRIPLCLYVLAILAGSCCDGRRVRTRFGRRSHWRWRVAGAAVFTSVVAAYLIPLVSWAEPSLAVTTLLYLTRRRTP